MSYGTIYKIQFPNGKNYIGLTTTSLEQRKKRHSSLAKNDTRILYNAIRKHKMVDTFELIEIDTADTLEELCEKEIRYIQEYNSYYLNKNGYNMTYGGEGTNGYVYTEEDKIKMSEAHINYFKKPEAIQKYCEAQRKRYLKDNERQKLSEAHKNYHKNNPDAGKIHGERMKNLFKDNPDAGKIHGERMKNLFKDNPEQRKKTLDTKGQNKPFDVFTIDGIFIETFTYQFEAMEYLQKQHNITSTIKISEVLAGNRIYTAGFVFKYKL